MRTDNAAVYWLVLATSISSVTTAILYLFQRCCGNCWRNIGAVCFQRFATSLELREETFKHVTNLVIFPRLFQQLQLETFKVVWHHDANAQTGDFVQWGWFRLPTKSYFLAFLSLCGVTHYVWIPMDLRSFEIVAPAAAIATLVDLSNVAATTRLTVSQIDTLRTAFGMDDTCTQADKVCTLWEKRIALSVLSACYLSFLQTLTHGLVRLMAGFFAFAAAVMYASRYNVSMADGLWHNMPWRERMASTTEELEIRLIDIEDVALQDSNNEVDLHLPGLATDETSNSIYSILTARGYYYEVVRQTSVIPNQHDYVVRFSEEAQMYGVQLQPNFVHYLAERTSIPADASLHICIHNPMIHPYLTEIYQNFQKGVDRENVCLVILPPLAKFNAAFQTHSTTRTRTATDTHRVATLGDFEVLLLQMTAGFLPKLVFVLPVEANTHDHHLRSPFDAWLSAERVLGTQNCHWVDAG